MPVTNVEPIHDHWSTVEPWMVETPLATAADVVGRLGLLDIADLGSEMIGPLAAAAEEIAHAAGIPWHRASDDPPVALLRLITMAAIRNPSASGPHTALLLERLGGHQPRTVRPLS